MLWSPGLSDTQFMTTAWDDSAFQRQTPSRPSDHLAREYLSKAAHVTWVYLTAVGILSSNGLGISPGRQADLGKVYA